MKTCFLLTFLLLGNACNHALDYGVLEPTPRANTKTTEESKTKAKLDNSPESGPLSGCETIALCKGECEKVDCLKQCQRDHSDHDIQKSNALIACISAANAHCDTHQCEIDSCQTKIDVCGGRIEYQCTDTLNCISQCDENDKTCVTYCTDLIRSEDVRSAFDGVVTCFLDHCNGENDCFQAECQKAVQRCEAN